MSSNILRINSQTRDIRILRRMLKQANYITAKLKPLTGHPLYHPSQAVLRRFMTGTMQETAK